MTKNILLVEYDEGTINTIKELLPTPLFELTTVNDGEGAKWKLANKTFDMMITAAMLPRFHGFNLALSVAQEKPGMKIIIISAIYKGLDYRHQATTQYRADDFFEKPLERERFKKRVFELLGIPASQPGAGPHPATTQVPVFDTAKIPVISTPESEEKKMSADDLFGDIIRKIDKVPEFAIDLEGGQAAKAAKAQKEEPRKSSPAETLLMKNIPPAAAEVKKIDPGKTQLPGLHIDASKLRETKRFSEESRKIDASLSDLRQQVKREMPETKMKKIEDDIAKKFEDTLSGLGFPKRAPSAAKPAEPLVLQSEERIADAGPALAKAEDAVGAARITEAPAAAAPVDPRRPEVREAKIEKKVQPEDNPNEVGDYVLLGLIARGGMAEIYKAKKKGVKGFEKVIAIKKIISGYGEDDKFIEMLVDEAKIAAELSHPNIVQIYDLGRKDNYYFIAMEYVPGKDLREIQTRLREQDQWFSEEVSLYLIIKILEALNYAHKAKDSRGHALEIVHRDVSPPNILISYNGDVKLTDFGISKASIKMHHTISGALKGKLLYMSPEQARGEGTIDCRSDLYSAGVVLFELLTGKKLFLDTSEMGVLKKVQNGEIIKPSELNKDIDPALEKIILKSLNKNCDLRYQSAAAMIADLEAYIVKKYNLIPGPVHLAHFMFRIFEKDILRDGIKVDLKPLPEKPLLREIPKAVPHEAPQPMPVAEAVMIQPPAQANALPPPVQPAKPEPEALVHIDFDEDKIVAVEKKTAAPPPAAKKPEAAETIQKPVTFLKETTLGKKKKGPAWTFVVLFITMAAAAVVYFMVLKKPATLPKQPEAQPTVQEKVAVPPAAAQQQPPAEDPAVLAAAKLKQEEELKSKLQAEEDQKRILEDRRKKQAESERLKKEEEDRLKQEEEARLQKQDAELKQQEETARLEKEAAEKKKAAELKEIERTRVKEGDIVPLSEVDKQPVAVSMPQPVMPASMRTNLPNSVAVLFNVLIDQNGDVEVATLLQKTNNNQLNAILIASVKSWKFAPAAKKGVRVKVWKTIPLTIKK